MGAVAWGRAIALGSVLTASGCCPDDEGTTPEPADSAEPVLPAVATENTVVAKDLFASVAECDVYHRGVLLDLGSPAMQGRYGSSLLPAPDVRDVVREGATWARVESGRITVSFYQIEESPVFVETRIRAIGARHVSVRIDGSYLGGLRIGDDIGVVSTSTTEEPLAPGRHEVSFTFYRSKRDMPKAEIDWIRIGIPDNDPTTYGAPTLRDLAIDAAVGGRPRKALAMRGPARVRCAFSARDDMRLQTTVGYSGPGEGEARIELVEPGKAPYLLHATKLGGEGKSAEIVDLPLDGHAGKVMAVDLIAERSSPGGRVLFGDPMLRVRRPDVPSRKKAKVVVVVVFSGASRAHLPPYETVDSMPTLTELTDESVVFHRHRAPTTVTTGSMASLVTGLSPAAHKVSDTGARLPDRFPTVGTIARDGRVATSMFTGSPTTFKAFGFARGWDRYAVFSPVSGTSARAPLREATQWVDARLEEDEERPLLVVVHARGGHPPWAVEPEEAEELPPKDYAGNINSRRGGQILAKERFRRYGRKRITADDRVRIQAFANLALAKEDEQIAKLVDVLREHEAWNSTMLVFTSDIAAGGGERIPYGDGEELGEDVLDIPLIVRFPERRFAKGRVRVPTTTMDVTRTILAAMGLDPADPMQGRDLLELAAYPDRFGTAPQFALRESSYSTRWGDWLLEGRSSRKPAFCELDPAAVDCAEDIADQFPFFSSWMWRMTYRHVRSSEAALRPSPSREPATLDPDTVAALTVWGNLEPKSKK